MKFLAGFFLGIIVAVGMIVWGTQGNKHKAVPKAASNDSFWSQESATKKELDALKKKFNDYLEAAKKKVQPVVNKPKPREKLSWKDQQRIHCFHVYKDECDCK